MAIPERIEFNGIVYHRMGGQRRYYLSYASNPKNRKHPKGLHVAVWEFAHQTTVPPGYEINHKDGNTFNNAPNNLECLPTW